MDDERSARVSDLGSVLRKYFTDHGLLAKSREMLAAFVWAEAVGPWYAQHTQVTRVKDGMVMVHCDSAPRAQQLQLDSPQILQRLNDRLGGEYIREIRAASGRVGRGRAAPQLPAEETEQLPEAAELAGLKVPEEQAELIAALAQKLQDEQLRQRFTATMHSFSRLQQWRRAQGYQPCTQCGRLVAPGQKCSVCYVGRVPQQGRPDFDEDAYTYGGERGGKAIRRSHRTD